MWITVTDIDGNIYDINMTTAIGMVRLERMSLISAPIGDPVRITHVEHDRIRKILGIKDEQ